MMQNKLKPCINLSVCPSGCWVYWSRVHCDEVLTRFALHHRGKLMGMGIMRSVLRNSQNSLCWKSTFFLCSVRCLIYFNQHYHKCYFLFLNLSAASTAHHVARASRYWKNLLLRVIRLCAPSTSPARWSLRCSTNCIRSSMDTACTRAGRRSWCRFLPNSSSSVRAITTRPTTVSTTRVQTLSEK